MKIKEKIFLSFLVVIIFFLIKEVYINVVSVLFEYYGFRNDYSITREIYSSAIVITTLIVLTFYKISPFLYSICYFIVLLSLLPNSVLYIYTNSDIWITLGSSTFILTIILLSRFKLNIKTPTVKKNIQGRILTIVSLGLLIPNIIVFGFNPNLDIFSLGDAIYDVRLAARTQDNFITGYTSTALVNILCPISLIIGIQRKQNWVIVISILIMLYLFTCYASKTVFLSIPMLIAFYFGSYFKKLLFTALSYITLCCFVFFYDIYSQVILFINGLFYNRLIFVPSLNIEMHFDFFKDKPLFLSGSIFRYFIEYPYDIPIPFVIGINYYGNADHAANVGFPADGYINFGVIGILIFNFIMSSVFIIFNTLNIDKKYFGLFILMLLNLLSTYLFTVFFTHGLLLLIIIAFFFLKQRRVY